MRWYRCEDEILRNLQDAGCDETTTEAFMAFYHRGELEQGQTLLLRQRERLLEDCHRAERQIGCLDYMLCQLRHKP